MNKEPSARAAAELFSRAWINGNGPEDMLRLLTDDAVFTGPFPAGRLRGKREIEAFLRDDPFFLPPAFQTPGSMFEQRPNPMTRIMTAEAESGDGTSSAAMTLTLKSGQWLVCGLNIMEHRPENESRRQEGPIALYNSLSTPAFRCVLNGFLTVLEAGDKFYEFLGYTREEFAALGGRLSAVIHPDDYQDMVSDLLRQISDGSASVTHENRFICRGGETKWVSINGVISDEEKGMMTLVCVFMDITRRVEEQEQLKAHYEWELSYFSDLTAANLLTKVVGNITNDVSESYIGNSFTTIADSGMSFTASVNNFARSAVRKECGEEIHRMFDESAIRGDFENGRTHYEINFQRRRSDGKIIWCNTTARSCLNPDSGDLMLFIYSFDVTERIIRDLLLQQISVLGYDYLADVDIVADSYSLITGDAGELPEGEVKLPLKGRFQEENRAVIEAYVPEYALDDALHNLSYDHMRRKLAEEKSYSFNVPFVFEDGVERRKKFLIYYIDEVMGRVCIARADITDAVQQEKEQREILAAALAEAEQANAAKSDFLSRMSHEIRTPMNTITGMCALAENSLGDKEHVADCISKIETSSRFLLSLINDILDMSRIESGKMILQNAKLSTAELLTNVNSICYSQAAAKKVDYECIVSHTLEDFYFADNMKLQQVLINIISNAIKFTSSGGAVSLSAEQAGKSGGEAVVRFVISDNGCGMNKDFITHVFEPFTQESAGTTAVYGGTGLGLAISKNIVDMMNGNISVRSSKGMGSSFTVDVRLGTVREEAGVKASREFAGLRVLVVDDNLEVCKSAVLTLRDMGVTGEYAAGGGGAVSLLRARKDVGSAFDVILIDWKMPEMGGMETARQIRAITGRDETKIIMTAYDWVAIEQEARRAGADRLMSKPLTKASLSAAISQALGSGEGPQAISHGQTDEDFYGKRVLLVEDHPLNTEIAARLLRNRGFMVDAAADGLHGLDMFRRTPIGYYNAILMDIRMPLMDGLASAVSIRQLNRPDAGKVPIIAMTANAFEDDIKKSRAVGMNAHLTKPIEPVLLYRTLRDLIYESEASMQ